MIIKPNKMDLLDTLVNVAQNECSMESSNTNTINLIKNELSSPPLKRKKSFIEDSNQDATDSEQINEHNISRTNNGRFEMTNLPKKPLTPYMSYRNMVFQDIKHKHPGCSPYDLACVISAKWSLLSDVERKVWEVKYDKEMKIYEKKLKNHQKSLKRKTNEDRILSPIGEEIHELNKFDTLDYCSGCKKLKELQGFSAEINGRQVYRGDLCSKACFLEASKQLKYVDGSTYIKHSNSDPVSVNLSPFNWAEYLSETNSQPADWMYCRQASYPPSNAFSVGMKLEARRYDQIKDSNQIIFSLATVAFMIGPRLLLHFDGSSSKYDIWTLCDSWDIHPVGWTDRGSLLPPTGYRHDPKNYMQFYSSKIQKAELATARCFKKVPSMPPKNCFEVGMKLEAVDKQNPSVIGVASVVRVQEELVYIEFDGYPGLGYSSHYGDRDFFPVGWCAHAKHPLRIPGDAKNTLSNYGSCSSSRYSPDNSTLNIKHSIHEIADKTLPIKLKMANQTEVCINVECICGPYIDVEKLQKLTPIRKGEIIPVLKGILEDIIACAISPKTVIGFLKPGRGNCVITTICEGTTFQCCLNVIDHVSSLWDILKQFADNLRSCPNLFSTEMYVSCPRCLNKPSNTISLPLIYQRLTATPGSFLASSFQHPKSSRFIEFEDGDIHSVMDLEKSEPLTSLTQLSCNQVSWNADKSVKKNITWPAFSQTETQNLQPVCVDTASQTESYCFPCKSLRHDRCITDNIRCSEGESETDVLDNIQAAGVDIKNRPSMWTVEDVVLFLKKTCVKEFSQVIKEHEIDGKALLLLQNEHILHHMGFKLGPAVKLLDLIEDLKVAENSFPKTKEFVV